MNAWISLVVLVIVLGALAAAIVAVYRGRPQKSLRWSVALAPETVRFSTPGAARELALSVARVSIWNDGDETILREDLDAQTPLEIVAHGEAQIRRSRLATVAAAVRLAEVVDRTRAPIELNELPRGQGVAVEILFTGRAASDLEVRGGFHAGCGVLEGGAGPAPDLQPAALPRRLSAAALDSAVVACAFFVIVLMRRVAGGPADLDGRAVAVYLGLLAALSLAYPALCALMGIDTAGLAWSRLRIVTFRGRPPDPRLRMVRLCGKYLSIAGFGFGLFWALKNRERFTWYDQVSRTFPAARHNLQSSH